MTTPLVAKESGLFPWPGNGFRIGSSLGGRPSDNESTIYADGMGAIRAIP